jgi:transcription antitermination factor NusG
MQYDARSVSGDLSSVHWFAVSTIPRHEKRIFELLVEREVETFLPLYSAERKWKKRTPITLDLPLFPTYIFVRIAPEVRRLVLDVPGTISFVGNGRQAIPVPCREIETLRAGLNLRKSEPHPYIAIGDRVIIKSGPLAGLDGVLVRRKNAFRVILAVELIMRSISVEINLSELAHVPGWATQANGSDDCFPYSARSADLAFLPSPKENSGLPISLADDQHSQMINIHNGSR